MGLTTLALTMRLVLFAAFQAVVALLLWLGGSADPVAASSAWWPLTAAATSVVTFFFLRARARAEGFSLARFYRPVREGVGRDILIAVGIAVLGGALAVGGSIGLAAVMFRDPVQGSALLSQPLPLWAAILSVILLPTTIALTELPLYFGYAQPRVLASTGSRWLAVALPAVFLSLQHATLPFVADPTFIAWRAIMFIGFAIVLGWALLRRPRLMPYLIVVHFLLDLQAAILILVQSVQVAA
ncbi:hypothetical protein BH11ACT4_BH11ACT4_24820 [soil metagenome]